MSDTFAGRLTEVTISYIIGGAASGHIELLLVAFGGGRNRVEGLRRPHRCYRQEVAPAPC